jgi:hypothetical protein
MSHWFDRLAKDATGRDGRVGESGGRPDRPALPDSLDRLAAPVPGGAEHVFTRGRGLQLATAAAAAIAMGPFRSLFWPPAAEAQPWVDCEGNLYKCLNSAPVTSTQILQFCLPNRPLEAAELLGPVLQVAYCMAGLALATERKRNACYDTFVTCSNENRKPPPQPPPPAPPPPPPPPCPPDQFDCGGLCCTAGNLCCPCPNVSYCVPPLGYKCCPAPVCYTTGTCP